MSAATTIARAAKEAFQASQLLGADERTKALGAMRAALEARKDAILEANREDVEVRLLGCFYSQKLRLDGCLSEHATLFQCTLYFLYPKTLDSR